MTIEPTRNIFSFANNDLGLNFVLLLLLVAGQLKQSSSQQFDYDVDIIIVGAGISGFACARELRRNGFTNFVILEGRNVTGGRFQSAKLGNVTVELGPNWIHGTKNNPLFDLIHRFGIQGKHEDINSIVAKDKHGQDITADFTQRRNVLRDIINGLDGSRHFNQSLREALTLSGWKKGNIVDTLVEYAVVDDMEGVPAELLSVPYTTRQGGIDTKLGKQFFITEQNGYKKLIDGLETLALEGDFTKLKLDHEVTRIHWNKHGVRVETSPGRVLTAKVLISTASNGVYQHRPNLFHPKLPKWKQDVFKKFKMATYTKIFLKFPYRFWDNVEYIFYASGQQGTFPIWQSLDAGNRYEWDTNILLIPVTGSESHRIENMKESNLIKEIMSHITAVYGSNVPLPNKILVPKWSSKKLFYGSFSYLATDASHNDFLALKANVGPVFFAGEATHEVYQSFVHGAYFEGINRACDAIQAVQGVLDTSNEQHDFAYHDSCLRDSCNCCHE